MNFLSSRSSSSSRVGRSTSRTPKDSTLNRNLSRADSDAASVHERHESAMRADAAQLNSLSIRYNKFTDILTSSTVDLDQLRKLSWSGIPDEIRPTVWKILMGYLPTNADRRKMALESKRTEYAEYIDQSEFNEGIDRLDQQIYHQIHIDVQRTNASLLLYQQEKVRAALERILYCWAIRHPASGYVQGINDLVTPFFQVFLRDYFSEDVDIENIPESQIPDNVLFEVEADSFWCLSKLLDGIQDHYTHAQPGIQRQVVRLKELIRRIDIKLYDKLQDEGVEFIQFAFRWMNCLLMREVSLKNTIRMWDSYQAEGSDGFSEFHLYVCAAFLVKWSSQLQTMEFQDIIMFLQSLPTQNWTYDDIELLLSEAFMWKSLFQDSPSHLSARS